MLQVDPLGLASRWKPGGPFAGSGGDVTSGWLRRTRSVPLDTGCGSDVDAASRYTNRSSTAKKANMPMRTSTMATA